QGPERLIAGTQDALNAFRQWAKGRDEELSGACERFATLSQSGVTRVLVGPTGERNSYTLLPRERVLCLADNEHDRLVQLAALLAVGSKAVWPEDESTRALRLQLPAPVQNRIESVAQWQDEG